MRSRPIYSFVLVALLMGGLGSLAAQTGGVEEIRTELESRFVLSPLTDGVFLLSREDGPGPRAIEVSGSTIAIDGQAVGTDELRARLGAETASWILALAELDDEALDGFFDRAGAAPEAPPAETEESEEAEAAAATETVGDEVEESAEVEVREERRSEKRRKRRTGDSEVAFAGNLTVEKDEVTEDVLVFGGRLKVAGRVEGDATVVGGSANIEGEVEGDVTAIGGPVRLEEGSLVQGDVTSVGGKVYREDGARVEGRIEQVPFNADLRFGPWTNWKQWQRYGAESRHFDFNPWGWWTGIGWKLIRLVFLAALAWISLLIARKPIDRMERRIEAEPWKTGLVGLLAQVLFFPTFVILAVFLAISIIGIPLLLVLPFVLLAVVIAGWLGLVAVAGRVGGWAEERFGWSLGSPFWVVLVGFGLLASLSIVGQLLDFGVAPMRFIAGMFLFFGGIVSFAAWTIACGAAVLTRFGTAESWSRAEEFAAPLPPVPTLDDAGGGTGDAPDAPGAEDAGDDLDWSDETLLDEQPGEPDEANPSDESAEPGSDEPGEPDPFDDPADSKEDE